MIAFSTLKQLKSCGDAELESAIKVLLVESARTEARVVMHLAELDRRRLHLRAGFPSLFRYCLETLGFSEFEAVFRIAAARLGQRFPLAFELLERRDIHLSALHLLRHHLTEQNHRELLAAACHKSKRQVELLVAHRFPRADVRPCLRELQRLEPLSPGRYRLELTIDEQTKQDLERACELLSHVSAAADFALVVQRGARAVVEQLEKQRYGKRAASGREQASMASQRGRHRTNRDQRLAPSKPTTPNERNERNERDRQAAAAGKNSGPFDAEFLVEGRAESPESECSLATERERSEALSGRGAFGSLSGGREHVTNASTTARARRHIPNHVRRAVAERDEGCCTFVSAEGRRCRSRQLLQIHHEQPWARGGADTLDNLRLLCAEHNRLLAEREFGAEHIERAREQRREWLLAGPVASEAVAESSEPSASTGADVLEIGAHRPVTAQRMACEDGAEEVERSLFGKAG